MTNPTDVLTGETLNVLSVTTLEELAIIFEAFKTAQKEASEMTTDEIVEFVQELESLPIFDARTELEVFTALAVFRGKVKKED
jgi:selenocysteine-specific translation elongation factor